MKSAPTRAATARVLADIDAAVRPVERARTAAAVDRVLATASPGHGVATLASRGYTFRIAEEVGVAPVRTYCEVHCLGGEECPGNLDDREDSTGGVLSALATPTPWQRERYAPHNVSPHLFPTDPS